MLNDKGGVGNWNEPFAAFYLLKPPRITKRETEVRQTRIDHGTRTNVSRRAERVMAPAHI